MPIRLGHFEKPDKLNKSEDSNNSYARYAAEPFETGFGHTIGNSLRRVLLSSLEGAAITSVRIEGADHEFATVDGVVEDVTDIVLNLKKIKFRHNDREPKEVRLSVTAEGAVVAGDLELPPGLKVVNKKQVICTTDKKKKVEMVMEVQVGRGFLPGDANKKPDQPIGVIPIDSIFSPVTRVRYEIEAARVGQRTDYDKLILELWTDGRLNPDEALKQASEILSHHLSVFIGINDEAFEFEQDAKAKDENREAQRKLLNTSVNEIELSVRAANCLNNANITTLGHLAMKSEAEMLKYRNFGKKSLTEIKEKLKEYNLSLGEKIDPSLLDSPPTPPPADAFEDAPPPGIETIESIESIERTEG
ncbi:MAG: DNA-directed RNA polymerase subunit alpha [Verrucomicrobiota bacterium]|nr:DNA-directed RNA polymerase subunit alpha [Verrucomicrobiota bacterium]